ncbi:hypothetical protein RclHR1_05820001 [Rhizophagus clarus]|uniref:F-box domain-containing protein n=1 Tax=Rhizophagus clarus TaxID=94130 RepID=A0A2Z6SH08_9GLOM|nr:hypothetical protein RclHR1_05820001 [Rhizophagus clarus]
MTCSKIFSGDLPELTNEIIKYFINDNKTLHSLILVNRLCCRLAIPLLWENPFSAGNNGFINIYLNNLNENDKTKLNDYGINKNLFPSNTLFKYPSFIKRLNLWNIIASILKWITTVRILSVRESGEQSAIYSIQNTNLSSPSHPEHGPLILIYESIFKIFIENEAILNIFEVSIFSNDDCYYFNIAFKLILQNQIFINNIKNLDLTIYTTFSNVTMIIPYLKSINSISSLNYHFSDYNDLSKSLLPQIINSQQNLKKIVFSSCHNPLNQLLFESLKNFNCSNTLKTIIFYKINFSNIFIFNEVFKQLNALESIHIIECGSLNSFIHQIINIVKPFKLKSLFIKEILQIELLKLLLQKSGNYIENIGFGSLISNISKQQSLELILRYCVKINFFDIIGFDNQNIYLVFNLIENIGHNLNYLSFDYINKSIGTETSSIILQSLGQILPSKLEYLNLTLMIKYANDFEIFLKNSQNTFINRLCIKNEMLESDDILPYIKEYIMKKRRVRHLAVKDLSHKSNDLFNLKDEFKLYNIEVQYYYILSIRLHYYNYFIKEMY